MQKKNPLLGKHVLFDELQTYIFGARRCYNIPAEIGVTVWRANPVAHTYGRTRAS